MTEKQMQRLLDRKREQAKQVLVSKLLVTKLETELQFAKAKLELDELRLKIFVECYLR